MTREHNKHFQMLIKLWVLNNTHLSHVKVIMIARSSPTLIVHSGTTLQHCEVLCKSSQLPWVHNTHNTYVYNYGTLWNIIVHTCARQPQKFTNTNKTYMYNSTTKWYSSHLFNIVYFNQAEVYNWHLAIYSQRFYQVQ